MDRSSSIRQLHAAGARSGARRPRLSIELRVRRPALESLARARRTSLSAVVRSALAEWLASRAAAADLPVAEALFEAPVVPIPVGGIVKATLLLPVASAFRLTSMVTPAKASSSKNALQAFISEEKTIGLVLFQLDGRCRFFGLGGQDSNC